MMSTQEYIALLKPDIQDSPRLAVLKSKYNRAAIMLNGFENILSAEERKDFLTQIKYYQEQIESYVKE
jgi:hypothetical protein